MKKRLAVIFVLAAAAGCLAACGDSGQTPQTFRITFVQAGQRDVVREVKEGETFTDIPAPKEREGYTVTWEDKDYTNVTESFTVNAVETANSYTVTYVVGDHGTLAETTQQVTYDAQYSLKTPDCKEGYLFVCWQDREGKGVTDSGIWKVADNVTLTAKYIMPVSVTFVQTGEPAVVKTVEKGGTLSDIPVPAERTGYTVTWDRADFTNLTENVTVNAVETPNTYTITYDPGEHGTLAETTQQIVFNSAYTLKSPAGQAGYTFSHWKTDGDKAVAQTGIWQIAKNVTLVAAYNDALTVTFVQTGKSPIVKSVEQGGTLSDIPVPAERTGYTVTWDRDDFTNLTESVTVNAVETPNTYTITYDAGEHGTLTETTQQVTFDAEYRLKTPSGNNNYLFSHWETKQGTTVAMVGTWTIAGDTALVAVYGAPITVTFVQNGQAAITRSVARGGTLTDIPVPAAKRGYTVTWNRKDFSNLTEDITVNAVETANVYTITYSLGERENDRYAAIDQTSQGVTFDQPYNLYTPTCRGYKFVKWVISGTQEELKNGTYDRDANIELTAVWELDVDSDRWWTDIY